MQNDSRKDAIRMTAIANNRAGDKSRNKDSLDAQALSALLDGELDADTVRAASSPAPFALPLSDECVATWRGYCLTGSVLRGELQGRGVDTLDLADRIRGQIAAEAELQAAPPASGRKKHGPATISPQAAHRARRWDSSAMSSVRARWQRAARARPRRLGTAVALGAAAISVAIGVAGYRSGAPSQEDINMAGIGVPMLAPASLSTPAESRSAGAALVHAPVTLAAAPARSKVPHVEAGGATVAHGQLPYFFAHASATNAAYSSGSMTLMPIAATDLAGGNTEAVRH